MPASLSKAALRNLKLVREGKVIRVYGPDGNVIRGGHPATLYDLEGLGLVKEGPSYSKPGLHGRYVMVLTAEGEQALDASEV